MFPIYNYSGFPPVYPEAPKFNETKNSGTISYILLFFLIIFFIIIVVLLFVNATTKSKLIEPEKCPSIKANYAVIPSANLSSLSIINSCSGNPDGYQGNQPCTFSNINSIYAAQDLCNKYENAICSGFAYNPTTNIVNFINANYNITSVDGNINPADVYLKQNI
jgi:hypothetical protein